MSDTPQSDEMERRLSDVDVACDALAFWRKLERELTATKRKLAFAEARVKELEKVAEAGWRLCCFNYQPWVGAGGGNECRHGISERFRCQRCDEMTVRNACSSGGTVKETIGQAMPRKET